MWIRDMRCYRDDGELKQRCEGPEEKLDNFASQVRCECVIGDI
jgi:hypothetical protein